MLASSCLYDVSFSLVYSAICLTFVGQSHKLATYDLYRFLEPVMAIYRDNEKHNYKCGFVSMIKFLKFIKLEGNVQLA